MSEETVNIEGAVCAPPLPHSEQIVMGHGAGGRMSHQLIQKAFVSAFQNPALQAGDDAAMLQPMPSMQLSISTDAHVVMPLFFPGGDIGKLAVCGTVNDVSMLGAKPLYLTAGFILEEGLEMNTLQRVIASMQAAAREAGVQIVAGDTKVVQKGKADGLYITTAGVGVIPIGTNINGNARLEYSPTSTKPCSNITVAAAIPPSASQLSVDRVASPWDWRLLTGDC